MNYYNEIDPKAAAWLRELIRGGHIPAGDVDTRSITEINPNELTNYTQCHFFAGIGGWSLALQLAGWPATRPVWTGSCPCQPFSVAGKGKGVADERHLWPVFFRLIAECKPATVFGEQVASKAGREWFVGVRADLEAVGYAVGGADLCAASVGAPHIRQRLYWVADAVGRTGDIGEPQSGERAIPRADGEDRWLADAGHEPARRGAGSSEAAGGRAFGDVAGCGDAGGVGHAQYNGLNRAHWDAPEPGSDRQDNGLSIGSGDELCQSGGVGHTVRQGREREPLGFMGSGGEAYWRSFDLLPCRDGKTRRIEPGSFPLAHGVPERVVRLRGYGNAIVPQLAAEFIKAWEEIR